MPKVTITLQDEDNGEVKALFHYEGGFNDESRAHVAGALIDQHMAVIMERRNEKTPVNLVDIDGHLALAPTPN